MANAPMSSGNSERSIFKKDGTRGTENSKYMSTKATAESMAVVVSFLVLDIASFIFSLLSSDNGSSYLSRNSQRTCPSSLAISLAKSKNPGNTSGAIQAKLHENVASSSSLIQTVLSVPDSHRILLKKAHGLAQRHHRRSGISPCPEEHYAIYMSHPITINMILQGL